MSCPIHKNHIREVINTSAKGTIFVLSDFSNTADGFQVGICLKRICIHAGLSVSKRFCNGFVNHLDLALRLD